MVQLMEQDQIPGLSVKAVNRSCGTQVKIKGAMRHFGVNHVKLQKTGKDGKPVFKEIEGKNYPEFVQKRDPETGDLMLDQNGKPIYETKAVPDVLNDLENEMFVDLIVNKKAVSNCGYKPEWNTEARKFYIVENPKWVEKK
jgi:hypothetical protein